MSTTTRTRQQREAEQLYGRQARELPTVALIENRRGTHVARIVREHEGRYLALIADQYREGVYFRAQVATTQEAATRQALSFGADYRVKENN